MKWLAGEEAIVGDVVSEDDKPIQHTKNEDAVWFTLMVIGAPIIVLTLGLVGTWARRRRSARKTEVTDAPARVYLHRPYEHRAEPPEAGRADAGAGSALAITRGDT